MTLSRKSVSGFYWHARRAVWDFREHLLVRLLSQQMRRTNTLYVHPDPQSGPFAVVRLINHRTGDPAPEEPHGHVEGSRKYELIPVFDWSEVPDFKSTEDMADWWDKHETTRRFLEESVWERHRPSRASDHWAPNRTRT